jgi:hypothetical protein
MTWGGDGLAGLGVKPSSGTIVDDDGARDVDPSGPR